MDSFKWIHFIPLLILFILVCNRSPAQKNYYVLFYNVENLFDPFNDPLTNDDDFTPRGANHWTKAHFEEKIKKVYKTILGACDGNFPDIIGLAEIENSWVLQQLITKTPLRNFPYRIIHKESPDLRGIDVGLLYREDRITPVTLDFYEVSKKGKDGFTSRDILYFVGKLDGIAVHFFVNHWPSRSEGYLASRGKRVLAANVLRTKIDRIQEREESPNILIMGDFNGTPKEESLVRSLKASLDLKEGNLINLSADWMKKGEGTIYRTGVWEIFDQFICSPHLLQDSNLLIRRDDTKICKLPFLLEKDPKYLKQKPFRTYMGTAYHGGISDHLPIVTVLERIK